MALYNIELNELLSRMLVIEADSEEEALTLAKQKYRNEEIVLDSSDYVDTEFKILKE